MAEIYDEKKVAFLGKWLWLLFLLVIPSTLSGIMTEETVTAWFPVLKLPGEILNFAGGSDCPGW